MWHCDNCDYETDLPRPPACLFRRRYWWHRKSADIGIYEDGEEFVAFPSPGKLIPETIIEGQ